MKIKELREQVKSVYLMMECDVGGFFEKCQRRLLMTKLSKEPSDITEYLDVFASKEFSNHRLLYAALEGEADPSSINHCALALTGKTLERVIYHLPRVPALMGHLEGYITDKEVDLIAKSIRDGLDVSTFSNKGLSFTQMQIVVEGLKSNIDVSKYNSPGIKDNDMPAIKNLLELGVDSSIILNNKFSEHKVRAIVGVFKKGKTISEEEAIKMTPAEIRKMAS